MNIPNLPTDSLYKFESLAGVLLILAGLGLSVIPMANGGKVLFEIMKGDKEIDIAKERLAFAKIAYESSAEQFTSIADEFKPGRIPEGSDISQSALGSVALDNYLLRYQFEEVKSRSDALSESMLKHIEALTFQRHNYVFFDRFAEAILFYLVVSVIVISIGIRMAKRGFRKWGEFQQVQDEILRLQLLNLKKEVRSQNQYRFRR